jgi:hypothetical protein
MPVVRQLGSTELGTDGILLTLKARPDSTPPFSAIDCNALVNSVVLDSSAERGGRRPPSWANATGVSAVVAL